MRKRLLCGLLAIVVLLSCCIVNVSAEESTNMKTSQEGINYIKSVEGFSKYPYYDYGQYTVGYGTRCPADKYNEYKTNGITDLEAEELLKQFLKYTEDEINAKIIDKYNMTLTQGQFDALVSLSFNIGTSWMTSSKNGILRSSIINPESTSNDIAYAFALYCNAGGQVLPGLVTRRLTEVNMFVNSQYSIGNTFGFIYYDANGGEVDYRIHGFDIEFDNSPLSARKSNNEFLGWYTQPVGGDKIDKIDASLNQKTLFAHWSNQNNNEIKVKVTNNDVNVRSGPGTNYEKIDIAHKDQVITITHVTHITNTVWGKFENGWISLAYTNYDKVISGDENINDDSTDVNEPEPVLFTGKVNVNDSLRVRSGPGTDYSISGYLKRNDVVEIYQTQNIADVTWGRIGANRWVSLEYVIIDKEEVSSPEDNGSEETEPQAPSTDSTGGTSTDSTVGAESTESTTPTEPETPTAPDNNDETGNTNNESTIDKPKEEELSKEPEQPTQPSQPESTPEETKPSEQPKDENPTILKGTVKVSDSLRVRSGAGLDNKTVGYLTNGQVVTIYEQKEVSNMTWGRIGDGKWVSLTYVTIYSETDSESENAKPEVADVIKGYINVQNSLRIRSAPGTTNKIMGYLGPKQVVTITETTMVGNVKWGKISDEKWISMEYVIIQNDSSNQGSDSSTPTTDVKTITADCLRVRSNAGTENKIVGHLYQGAKVIILETKTAKDGTLWGRIDKGWISMSYTK